MPNFILRVFFLLITLNFSLYAGLDEDIYQRVQSSKTPFLDAIMKITEKAGERETSLALLLTFSTFGNKKQKDATKLSTISLFISQAACAPLKYFVNRKRPDGERDRFNSSFPSGHAAGAFSLAYTYGEEYHNLRIPLYFMASLVSFSRIYLSKHYPSDCLVGAGIGILSGMIVVRNREKLLKSE
jgi:undecaprenyl-diphosphatase